MDVDIEKIQTTYNQQLIRAAPNNLCFTPLPDVMVAVRGNAGLLLQSGGMAIMTRVPVELTPSVTGGRQTLFSGHNLICCHHTSHM